MKLIIIILNLIICMFGHLMAQNKEIVEHQDSIRKIISVNANYDKLDSLQIQLLELNIKVIDFNSKINALNDSLSDKELIINRQNILIEKLEHKLVFADSIVARLANDCLRFKYDSIKVKNALSIFSKIYSVELQKKFSPLKSLLLNYETYYNDIISVILGAQNDESFKNPFSVKKISAIYIEKLKSTNYYLNIYNSDWTILYLNKLIDESIKRLNSYEPIKEKLDFQDLLL